ncbi:MULTISPECIES: phospholipid carrier-dependent glycosyltransferase [unclassified Streptomyces]|uniref:phospholipid carrier-dependent glycosyltransferase n=1 Tax=unclassified Streptomyces TaxID=2593676 RepID=UPI00247460EF|nr:MULTISPECIES: phospholipid carrier-dependent glycosyltransferase [unclassified Streptomyces]MDH6455107.1 4-amino-4-deoxy-L-arabinose transferase-like glycosyltransferase [Streptomyces sp. SAI-119]MDH6494339.1 4-amino-4-deoxy-L-arabinose transferase-like glycosyltransferase [Streptomyces sp. SAI-149]
MMASEQQTVLDPAPGSPTRDDEVRRPRKARRRLVPLLVAVLLAQMAAAMVTTAVQQTPTIDEPVYVATAAEYLHGQGIRYNPEHPPLGKLVIAVGVAIADPHVDTAFDGPQIDLGPHLLYESGNDPWQLMFWGRLPVIVLTLLFGLVVFTFARELAGTAAGLAALALYSFSPDVVAHGSLATLDVPTAGFLLTSVWLLWRARVRPRLYVPLAGLALGAALATKMSALPAVPVLLGLAAFSVWSAARDDGTRKRLLDVLAGAAVLTLTAVAVVWASYLVVDPRLRWTSQDPVPVVHGLRGTLVDLLPFPQAYADGMRLQFRFENHPWEGFLFGRVYTGHLWYYLPAALLVKTPLGLLALWAAGAVVLVTVRRLRPAAPYLLVPAGVLLASAMTGSRDFGTRYVLFLPMFLTVAAGCVLAVRRRPAIVVTAALVLFVAVSSLRAFPFYLPYSNEAFGGPARTHLRLHDSNVDWGQDLGRLADRLRERYPDERIWLVYKGSGVPSAYGIEASDPREVPVGDVRGLLVVSDSSVAKAKGRLAELIDSSRPVDEVGHSITIYRR